MHDCIEVVMSPIYRTCSFIERALPDALLMLNPLANAEFWHSHISAMQASPLVHPQQKVKIYCHILYIYLLLNKAWHYSMCQPQAVIKSFSWTEFSSLIAIEESLVHVAETSSSEYPTLLFSKGFKFVLGTSSCTIPFKNASCISTLSIAFTGISHMSDSPEWIDHWGG